MNLISAKQTVIVFSFSPHTSLQSTMAQAIVEARTLISTLLPYTYTCPFLFFFFPTPPAVSACTLVPLCVWACHIDPRILYFFLDWLVCTSTCTHSWSCKCHQTLHLLWKIWQRLSLSLQFNCELHLLN